MPGSPGLKKMYKKYLDRKRMGAGPPGVLYDSVRNIETSKGGMTSGTDSAKKNKKPPRR